MRRARVAGPAFDVELVIQLRALGLSVLEVPIDAGWLEEPPAA
jgi:hypothetical protein